MAQDEPEQRPRLLDSLLASIEHLTLQKGDLAEPRK
jgi:hypothetical protein